MSHVASPAANTTNTAEWTPLRRVLVALGALTIAATWLYFVLVHPSDWDQVTNSGPGIALLAGYGVGTLLLLAAVIPVLPARTLGLIPIAIIINSVIGEIVGSIGLPLYLDSVGTVLVAALAGPVAGMATGALNNVVSVSYTHLTLPTNREV